VSNPLQNLKVDYWYKAILVIGAVTLILSLTVDLKGIENSVVQIYSLAAILIGCGEWVNHPLQTKIYPPVPGVHNGLQGEGYTRDNSLVGVLLVIFGVLLLCYQLWLKLT
jgi:hypothetical protein